MASVEVNNAKKGSPMLGKGARSVFRKEEVSPLPRTNETYNATFDGRQHAEFLHPGEDGYVFMAQKCPRRGWEQKAIKMADVGAAADFYQGDSDVYIQMNAQKKKKRDTSSLFRLSQNFVDLDYYKLPHYAGRDPEEILVLVNSELEKRGIPLPSLSVFSGRGLQIVWSFISPIDMSLLPAWNHVQMSICNGLKDFGADGNALDAVRVLRLVGTKNGQSDQFCRLVVPPEPRVQFEELRKCLPPTEHPKEILSKSAKDKYWDRKANATPNSLDPSSTRFKFLTMRCEDLERLVAARSKGVCLPAGDRDRYVFIFAATVAWLDPKNLRSKVQAFVDRYVGWGEDELEDRMYSVFQRAEQDIVEKSNRYRYRFTSKTIVERLSISESEMVSLGLQTLVSPDIRKARRLALQRERETRNRRQAGATPRSELAQNSLESRKPWTKLGIHRSTYYRRRKEGKLTDIGENATAVRPRMEGGTRGTKEGTSYMKNRLVNSLATYLETLLK